MKTKGVWQGVLSFEDDAPKKIKVGNFTINSIFHFLSGKRVILIIEMISSEEQETSGQLSTVGSLQFDEKKKEFIFEKHSLLDILESFIDQKIKIHVELDESVLSSRM